MGSRSHLPSISEGNPLIKTDMGSDRHTDRYHQPKGSHLSLQYPLAKVHVAHQVISPCHSLVCRLCYEALMVVSYFEMEDVQNGLLGCYGTSH